MRDYDQIEECYTYALDIVTAIVDSINGAHRSGHSSELGKMIQSFIDHQDIGKKDKLLFNSL